MRLAFLGTGAIARTHAKRLRRYRDFELAFASRDPARAEAIARDLGGASYPSYDAAINAPDVDIVAVVTPPDSHAELTLSALAAGKHVVLEKPAFLRAAEVDQVAAAAARANRRVFVAENYHYKPSLVRLCSLLAERVVGDVLFIHINALRLQTPPGWRKSLGALYEGGIHWVDFMAKLGEVRSVRGHAPAPRDTVERSMLLTFDYAGGAIGTLAYSWEVPATAKGLRISKIYGRNGTITFETNGIWILCHGTKTRLYLPGLRDVSGHRAMWADFVQAWRNDTDAAMTLAHARRDLELVEQAYTTAGL